MPKFRVPVRVSVAPVRTYRKTVVVEAADRREAAKKATADLHGLFNSPGWRAVGGRLETTRPDLTSYHPYLDEQSIEEWVRGPSPTAPDVGGE